MVFWHLFPCCLISISISQDYTAHNALFPASHDNVPLFRHWQRHVLWAQESAHSQGWRKFCQCINHVHNLVGSSCTAVAMSLVQNTSDLVSPLFPELLLSFLRSTVPYAGLGVVYCDTFGKRGWDSVASIRWSHPCCGIPEAACMPWLSVAP